jgi:hypothetical protein
VTKVSKKFSLIFSSWFHFLKSLINWWCYIGPCRRRKTRLL